MNPSLSLSLFRAADDYPQRVALIVDGVPHSYEDVARMVRRTLGWLHGRGLGPRSSRVALVAPARMETILVVHSLVEMGVPVVLLHPRLLANERDRLLTDSQPALYIDEAGLDEVAGVLAGRKSASAASPVPELPRVGTIPDERCLAILYTSGTTGRPRGAMLSRAAFCASALASAQNLSWQPEDRWLLCMPPAHVGGLSIVLRCLLARCTVVLPTASRFDPSTLWSTIQRDRVTLVSLVPTMLQRFLQADLPLPPHVRAILAGGAPASPDLLVRAAERRWPVLTTYGLTEACSQVTTQRYGTRPSAAQGAGEPLPGMQVRIVDGQIQVRGPALFSGYFPPGDEPVLSADGWFATGDLGQLDEKGRLHVLSRRTDLIVTGGENVYPAEVEQVLQAHPLLSGACVFGVPDETWGQLVAAAVVPAGTPPDPGDLQAYLQENLAPHKRPRLLACLQELPLLGTGKVDRAAVARAAAGLLLPIRSG